MTLNSEGLEKALPCVFCQGEIFVGEVQKPDGTGGWKKSGYRASCRSCEMSMKEATTKDEAISAWNRRALPPVDGLEEANEALMRERTSLIETKREQIERLTKERDDARKAFDGLSAITGKIAQERSTLKEENKRLREALGNAERSFNNIRGAIESNQVVDKDAHGTAVRARDAARQALEDHNG